MSMRAVVQRVSSASVSVAGEVTGEIATGFLVLLGIAATDSQDDVNFLAAKICGLRVFEDDAGKMNLSLAEAGGALLVVSQFTLYGDCRKGRRPSFIDAARPEQAEPLYQSFLAEIRGHGIPVASGRFQQQMEVALVNHGPVTLLLDSRKVF
jgi:D-tyrosyl-tRNA(Tyr) deacylase